MTQEIDNIISVWSTLLAYEGYSPIEQKAIRNTLSQVSDGEIFSDFQISNSNVLNPNPSISRNITATELTCLIVEDIRASLLEVREQQQQGYSLALSPKELSSYYLNAIMLFDNGEKSEYGAAAIAMFLMIEAGLTFNETVSIKLRQIELIDQPTIRILNKEETNSIQFHISQLLYTLVEEYIGARLTQTAIRLQRQVVDEDPCLLASRKGPYSPEWLWRIISQVWIAAKVQKPIMLCTIRATLIRQTLTRVRSKDFLRQNPLEKLIPIAEHFL